MNHNYNDYAHCIDWSPDCPKNCFRAQLERDLMKRKVNIAEVPIVWKSFGWTAQCKRNITERLKNAKN